MTEQAESVRFWRLNSLAALRMTRASEREAVDPDDLTAIKASNAELMQLEAQEKAVKARHARIISNRKPIP